MAEKLETTGTQPALKFTKEQILSAKKYQNRRDILSYLLSDGEMYLIADIDKKIEKFLKEKVK